MQLGGGLRTPRRKIRCKVQPWFSPLDIWGGGGGVKTRPAHMVAKQRLKLESGLKCLRRQRSTVSACVRFCVFTSHDESLVSAIELVYKHVNSGKEGGIMKNVSICFTKPSRYQMPQKPSSGFRDFAYRRTDTAKPSGCSWYFSTASGPL